MPWGTCGDHEGVIIDPYDFVAYLLRTSVFIFIAVIVDVDVIVGFGVGVSDVHEYSDDVARVYGGVDAGDSVGCGHA
eukprot:CAMPEP_0198267990 /NCGR_PEP_ID=MMETSP1447-20131203/35395_1 /TAXON_ID=420782 /ORGANISM="Chaetoceros dichaeta, Strain CCMP1751" /LENGTH=76 /DNA_ID=CAMNT_0043958833 /DNA_START=336 /DNA_END=566 /DNA_ORIENTATION=+